MWDKMEAPDFFELCAKRKEDGDPIEPGSEVTVADIVARCFLDHTKTPRVILSADRRGLRTIDCHCVTDEVLFIAREGERATLRGSLLGMEDSLTVVVTACAALPRVDGQHEASEVDRKPVCRFCGSGASRTVRLIVLPGGVICGLCARKLKSKLK